MGDGGGPDPPRFWTGGVGNAFGPPEFGVKQIFLGVKQVFCGIDGTGEDVQDARAADNCAVLIVVGLLVVVNSNLLEAQAHSQEGSGGSGDPQKNQTTPNLPKPFILQTDFLCA